MNQHSQDWSEHSVLVQPLARALYEQMNRHEWCEAQNTALKLMDAVQNIHVHAIKSEVLEKACKQ